jgi:hypothetical protein
MINYLKGGPNILLLGQFNKPLSNVQLIFENSILHPFLIHFIFNKD